MRAGGTKALPVGECRGSRVGTLVVEIVVELLGELVVGIVLVAVAYAMGSVVFLLVRAARLLLGRLNPPPDVMDPTGRRWVVRVGLAPAPLRYRMSGWFFRMRPADQAQRSSGGDLGPDMVDRNEIAHPSGLLERFDEAAGLVVWAVLAVTLMAVVVLAFEVAVVAAVAAIAMALRTVTGTWQCELITPDGRRFHIPAGSLAKARRQRERLRSEITAGSFRIPSFASDH